MIELKKRLETWHDVRDEFDNLAKRQLDRFAWHQDILHRYKNGRLTVHLHLAGRINGTSWSGCLEARVCQPDDAGAMMCSQLGVVPQDDLKDIPAITLLNTCDGEQGQSMFVLVCENGQPFQRIMPSVIRLRPLDCVNRRCGDIAGDKLLQGLRSDKCRVVAWANRKSNSSLLPIGQWDRVIAKDQLPSDVVQTGAKVADTVPENGAQMDRWFVRDLHRVYRDLIVLNFDRDFIRVATHVGAELVFESVQVFLSPDDFEPSSI